MALTKLTKNLIDGTFGTEWVSTIQTSNFTAEAAKGYFVNTTAGAITVNLPAGVVGTEIVIQDYAGTFATNKVLLNPNGSEKIQGSSTLQGEITTNNATATLVYQDATKGWTSQDVTLDTIDISWGTPTGQGLTYTVPSPQSSSGYTGNAFPTTTFTATISGTTISGTANFAGLPSGITATQSLNNSNPGNVLTVTLGGVYPSADSLNTIITLSGLTLITPLAIEYLVVAGGGGGGHVGGGGAGGYRTNYGGTKLTLAVATNYGITIGAGGNGSTSNVSPANATSGSNSVFSNITSAGGGYGGANTGAHTNGIAADGGSGGGGGWDGTAVQDAGGDGNTPSTSPSQGNNGGSGGYAHPYYAGGGGGGANTVGQDKQVSGSATGGAGGDGLQNNITGSAVIYAGGGGGQGMEWTGGPSGRTGGAGGAGGGGQGGGSTTPTNGGINLGGGGGSPGYLTTGIGAGGSGVVILRYPNSYTISGLSGTTTTVGSYSVTTFTNVGTGNIQFN